MKSVNKKVKHIFVLSVLISFPLAWFLYTKSGGSVLSISTHLAHRDGCHRWHSCPSDTGSYICGDLGYPCQYDTYSEDSEPVYIPNTYLPSVSQQESTQPVTFYTPIPVPEYNIEEKLTETSTGDSSWMVIAVVSAIIGGYYFLKDKKK